MQRDMELIRKILFAIEDKFIDVSLDSSELVIDGYDYKTVGYHCAILCDAGLIYDYEDEYGDDELSSFCVGRLTWEGHDFLDKIRSETVWNKTKETIVKKGLPFVFDVVKELATANMGDMIKVAISCM